VGGKLAQLGQRLIDGAAKSLAEDFFKRFDESLQAKYPSNEAETEKETKPVATVEAAPSSGSVPSWVWLALLVGAGAVWYMVR
jgi:hypothetical protein